MFAKSVLVTGCSRGIGLELVKQLLDQTEHLFATCRSPDTAKELTDIADTHKNIVVLQLDVTNEESINKAVKKISEIVGDDGLNCLINNAGILYGVLGHPIPLAETPLDTFYSIHETNVIGPVMMIKSCLPLLRQASASIATGHMGVSRGAIINISSRAGSITVCPGLEFMTSHAYRMSKASLNMLTKMLSIEYKPDDILVVAVCPGWVRTDMGTEMAPVTAKESVEGILKVTSELDGNSTGMFYRYDGETLPW